MNAAKANVYSRITVTSWLEHRLNVILRPTVGYFHDAMSYKRRDHGSSQDKHSSWVSSGECKASCAEAYRQGWCVGLTAGHKDGYEKGMCDGFSAGHKEGYGNGYCGKYSRNQHETSYSASASSGPETAFKEGSAQEISASKRQKKGSSGNFKLWYDKYTTQDKADLEKFPHWLCWNDFNWVPFQEKVQEKLRQESDVKFETSITIDIDMGEEWDYTVTVLPAKLIVADMADAVEELMRKFPKLDATLSSHGGIVGWQENKKTLKRRPVKVVSWMPMLASKT